MRILSTLARRTAARFIPQLGRVACSGCGRPNGPDVKIISGPGVYLCQACFTTAAAEVAPRRPVDGAIRCRFCLHYRVPSHVATIGAARVCADCLGTMDVVFESADRAAT